MSRAPLTILWSSALDYLFTLTVHARAKNFWRYVGATLRAIRP